MKHICVIASLGGLALLYGCAESSDVQSTVNDLGTTAIFSPTTGDIPLPNDLLFAGSLDGTLNPPVSANPGEQGVFDALSALDGWGTNSAFQVQFSTGGTSAPLDPLTVVPGTTVRLFEVTLNTTVAPVGGPVSGVVRELDGTVPNPLTGQPVDPTADYMALAEPTSATSIVVLPLKPFDGSTSYMLNITNGVLDTDGDPVRRSIVYQLASDTTLVPATDPLAPLQGIILSMHAAAATQSIDPDDIVISVQFSTQSIGDVMGNVAAVLAGNEAAVIAGLCAANPNLVCTDTTPDPNASTSTAVNPVSIGTTGGLVGSPADAADVYVGSLTLPYFLTAPVPGGPGAADVTSDDAPVTENWRARYEFGAGDTERNLTRFNSLPAITEQETVPMLITLPKGVAPVDGWPVVVFQHGITGNRTNLFGIADALAIGGFAAVAIDLPLHGVDSANPLFTSYQDGVTRERTFGLDLSNNSTQAPTPDGIAEPSGSYFINLNYLRLSRDNLRQAASDILALLGEVSSIDIDGDTQADFDANEIHFVGHSLGAITGTVALTYATNVATATLGMPGGGLAKLLANSPSFMDAIEAGLAANGILPGTPEFETFLVAAQTVADSGDPINYAQSLAATGLPIHLIEVVGLVGFNDPDQTIPNSVPGAPLSGTEPLIRAFGLTPIVDDTVDVDGIQGVVRYTEGGHSSLLLPDESIPAFLEMQAMTVEFASTRGQMLTVTDDDIVLGGPGAN